MNYICAVFLSSALTLHAAAAAAAADASALERNAREVQKTIVLCAETNHFASTATYEILPQFVDLSLASPQLDRMFITQENGMVGKSKAFKNDIFQAGLNGGEKTAHELGHIWPMHYMNAYFKHGLLNHFIYEKGGLLIRNQRPLRRGEHPRPYFKQLKIADEAVETRLKLKDAVLNGIQRNEFLVHVGGCAQKLKFRLENEESQNAQENDRCDLLQEYAYTVVSKIFDLYKKIEEKKLALASLNLVEVETLCTEMIDFFSHYAPTLTGIPLEDLSLLKNHPFPEDTGRAVNEGFKAMIDRLDSVEDPFRESLQYYKRYNLKEITVDGQTQYEWDEEKTFFSDL